MQNLLTVSPNVILATRAIVYYDGRSIAKALPSATPTGQYVVSPALPTACSFSRSTIGESLKSLLSKSIDVLQLLTQWQKNKLKEANINTIEELHKSSEENLISEIYNVGPARARLMKNAATAELLEYISG